MIWGEGGRGWSIDGLEPFGYNVWVQGQCLDDNEIPELLGNRVSAPRRLVIEDHLDACPDCRRMVANVARAAPIQEVSASGIEETDPGLDPRRLPPPGQMIAGRFRIIQELGRGGMGAVLEAEDHLLGGRVALKLLSPALVGGRSGMELLLREARITRPLNHPNICRVFDVGFAGTAPFITMELLEGETLAARIARGDLGADESGSIIRDILAGLGAAHARGVVHRDLKPGNVMLLSNGRACVMDFGLARDLGSESSHGMAVVGTPAYWSPEQARGEPATPSSDLYALGLLMARMFVPSGRRLVDPRAALAQVPRRLRPLASACLQADPDRRVASAEEALLLIDSGRGTAKFALTVTFAVASVAVGVCAVWMTSAPAPRSPQAVTPPSEARPAILQTPEHVDTEPPPPVTGSPQVVRPVPPPSGPVRPRLVASSQPKVPREQHDRPALASALRVRVDAVIGGFAEKHLISEDVPLLWDEALALKKSLANGDRDDLHNRVAALEERARAVAIDRSFLSNKLKRITAAAAAASQTRSATEDEQLKSAFARVHTAYFAGDYVQANRHLTDIRRLLGHQESEGGR